MQVNGPNPIFERHKRLARNVLGVAPVTISPRAPASQVQSLCRWSRLPSGPLECLLMSANLTHDTACAATAPPPPCASASGPGSPMPDLTGFMLPHLTVDDAAHQAVNITS